MKNDNPSEAKTDISNPIYPSLPRALSRRLGVVFLCLAVVVAAVLYMVACDQVETGTEKETEASSVENSLNTTESESLPSETPRFTFGYDPFGGFAIPGDLLTITTWVINEGDPFTFEGSSKGYAPTATLVHRESGYRIQGNYATTMDLVRFTVNTKDKGQADPVFAIPTSAPTGEYDLYLSFDSQEQIFENVLTVAIP